MGFSYSPKVVTDGLVLYLDAANTLSYANGSTKWNDLSRGRNNGTLINGPSFQDNAIVFDGTNDELQVDDCVEVLPQRLTLELWVKAQVSAFSGFAQIGNGSTAINNKLFVRGSNSGADHVQYFGYYETTSLSLAFAPLGGNPGIPMDSGSFYQHVVWFDTDGTYGSYVNGEENSTGNTPADFSRWYIDYQDFHFYANDGSLGLVKIYNRALTAQEVQRNYQALKSRFGL